MSSATTPVLNKTLKFSGLGSKIEDRRLHGSPLSDLRTRAPTCPPPQHSKFLRGPRTQAPTCPHAHTQLFIKLQTFLAWVRRSKVEYCTRFSDGPSNPSPHLSRPPPPHSKIHKTLKCLLEIRLSRCHCLLAIHVSGSRLMVKRCCHHQLIGSTVAASSTGAQEPDEFFRVNTEQGQDSVP